MRKFLVVSAKKYGQKGKNTKFSDKSQYSGTPERAARKAFSNICRSKKIFGQCSLNIHVQEVETTKKGTPKTSKGVRVPIGKVMKYRLKRVKDPVNIMRNDVNVHYDYSVKSKSLQ
jgi:hypothetical protein